MKELEQNMKKDVVHRELDNRPELAEMEQRGLLSKPREHELVPKREETIGAIGYIPKGTLQAKTAFHTLFFGKYSFNIRSSILLSEIPVSLICALCY